MYVVVSADHVTWFDLATDDRVGNPFVLQNLCHLAALSGVELEHTADDMPGLAREQTQDSPGAANDLSFLACRLARRVVVGGWSSGAGGSVV